MTGSDTHGGADDIAYATALVRAEDRPRYYATLFAPQTIRGDLFALYGFAAEIARVPDQVREATLGEMRLKWWSDALTEAVLSDGVAETPALRAVAKAIVRHALPIAPFHTLIDARSADLYSDPPATIVDLEGRMGETESVLFQMAAIMAGSAGPETADAAGHAGVAYGIARRLSCFASERMRQRSIVPADILAQFSLTPADPFAPAPAIDLAGAIRKTASLGHQHLALAHRAIAALRPPRPSIFLPLAVVEASLRHIERTAEGATDRNVALSDFGTLARIAAAKLMRPDRFHS